MPAPCETASPSYAGTPGTAPQRELTARQLLRTAENGSDNVQPSPKVVVNRPSMPCPVGW